MLSTILWVAFWVLVYLVVSVALCSVLFRRRRPPSSYVRRADDLAWWGLLPAEEQEVADLAVLDAGEETGFRP